MRAWLVPIAIAAALAAGAWAPADLPSPTSSLFTWTPEQHALAFRRIEDVWPHQVVRRGPRVRPLPVAARPIDPRFDHAGQAYDTARYMADTRAAGVLVLHKGRIVLERYGLGRTPAERWVSFSVTKSVTSTLMGAAIRDGHIRSLDDPVARYVPDLKGGIYEEVTLRQLVTMSSGVRWNENYADPDNDAAKFGREVTEAGVNPVVTYMRGLARFGPPGVFHYNTGETDLAGLAISGAVGKPLAQYLSEKIWRPFGMEADAIWPTDAAGHERGGCCLAMTLRDYGRFGLYVLEASRAPGRHGLPDGWFQDATRAHMTFEAPPGAGYGYFWWTRPAGVFEAIGVYGQSITVFPQDEVIVVVNSAWPRTGGQELHDLRLAFAHAARLAAVTAR